MVGGSPSMAKRQGLAANPDHPGPEHAQKTSPPCMGHSDRSIKAHSTVSIASHNMHGAHTPLTSTILLQGSPNGATVKPVFKGHLNIQEEVSLHDRCPFVTGSLTWGRYNTVLRKCPLISDHRVSPRRSVP